MTDSSGNEDYKIGGKLGFQSNVDDFLNIYNSVAKENPERLFSASNAHLHQSTKVVAEKEEAAVRVNTSKELGNDTTEYTFDIERRMTNKHKTLKLMGS